MYSQFSSPDTALVSCVPRSAPSAATCLPHPSALQSLPQLEAALPDLARPIVQLLLETLVSRRLLRPFVVRGELFWQKP